MNAEEYLTTHWIKHKVWRNLTREKHQERFRTICSFLEGKTFIDVGCACGHSTDYMSAIVSGIWIGIDFSEQAILKAKGFFPQYKFYYADIFDLVLETGQSQFDSVVCSEMIEHVKDDQLLLDELLSITKKVLVITTPNRQVGDPGHLRLYTANDLLRLFNNRRSYKQGRIKVQIISHGNFFYLVIHK